MTRRTIGSILKPSAETLAKNPKAGRYIKINEDVVLSKGTIINLESKQSKIESLQAALASGKLSEEYVEKLIAQAEKMPDFVAFDLVVKVPKPE